jgi:hypothetical protein
VKIVQLKAENLKRLTAVEITPTGDVVQITGANGSGKSSVLDAIYYALGGKGAIPSTPVRRGAEHALIELDLGDMVVKRRFDADGSTARQVESKDGAAYKSPQTLLDAMLGRMTFDPLEFLRLKPREQLDMLRSVVTVDVDLDKLDGLNRADYDKRTDINRDEKKKRAEADAIVVPADLPASPIDLAAKMLELEKAAEHNASIDTRKARRADVQRQINVAQATGLDLRTRAEQLRAEAAELDARAAEAEKQRDDLQARLDSAEALPEPIDVSAVRADIERAQEVNRGIELRTRKTTLRAEADGMKAAADLLTAAIDARKARLRRRRGPVQRAAVRAGQRRRAAAHVARDRHGRESEAPHRPHQGRLVARRERAKAGCRHGRRARFSGLARVRRHERDGRDRNARRRRPCRAPGRRAVSGRVTPSHYRARLLAVINRIVARWLDEAESPTASVH